MKAQREVTETVAQNREFGEGGLLVVLRLLVFCLLFRAILLRRLLTTFTKVMRGLTVLQARGVDGGVAQTSLQQLFLRASFKEDFSKASARGSLSSRTDAFWSVV